MNSARVAGGAAPLPAHSNFPEPQSPVTQENLPDESSLQMVRPQKRPAQPEGAERVFDSPFWREKPVAVRGVEPAFDSTPGQTVYAQLLVNVNEPDKTPAAKMKQRVKDQENRGREDIKKQSDGFCLWT